MICQFAVERITSARHDDGAKCKCHVPREVHSDAWSRDLALFISLLFWEIREETPSLVDDYGVQE